MHELLLALGGATGIVLIGVVYFWLCLFSHYGGFWFDEKYGNIAGWIFRLGTLILMLTPIIYVYIKMKGIK